MVLISGAGNTTVVFWSTPISTRLWRLRSCRASGRPSHVGGGPELVGGQCLALGGDDLGPLLAFGLGLAGHGPLHGLGQLDVLELDQGHHHPPVLGGPVQDLADGQVDGVGLGQGLVQGVLADDLAQGVWAIWLMAAATFSIATTERVASVTR
jgi:hypothetical protein